MSKDQTPADRLRAARESAGYGTARSFWSKHGIAQATYQNHEAGSRAIRPEQAKRYAELLDIDPVWLLTGAGETPALLGNGETWASTRIAEIDVRAEAGAGGLDPSMGLPEDVLHEWRMPTSVITAQTSANKADLRIIRVFGDSMQPLFRPGDRVLVDLSDRLPSPPGIFVLWDGLGIVIKRVEFVAYSDPKSVRFSSVNPAYEAYTRPLQDVVINGRVIGRWDWT